MRRVGTKKGEPLVAYHKTFVVRDFHKYSETVFDLVVLKQLNIQKNFHFFLKITTKSPSTKVTEVTETT